MVTKTANRFEICLLLEKILITDMRKILINNIKIHMNVHCAEMTSSGIANLTILGEVQNVKTFFRKNM